jgi:N-acetylglucosamine kinase-like BadF-type ATPase
MTLEFIGKAKVQKQFYTKVTQNVSRAAKDGDQFVTNGLPDVFFSIKVLGKKLHT